MRFECRSNLGVSAFFAVWIVFFNGCKQAPELPVLVSPHKIDVQQGNVVTQEMLSKLKPGMTPSQVKFVMGSPLVVDPFRLNRWDYVSTFQSQGKEVERRRITIIFADDKLVHVEGDVAVAPGMEKGLQTTMKSVADAVATDAKKTDHAHKEAASATPQPGFFSRILNKLGF